MNRIIARIKTSSFVRNMSIVMTGTAIAQIIGFALTPVISRLFTQGDFGIFGSFNSVLAVVAAGVTLQYSQAIMLPKQDEDAANVFAVSILSVFVITMVGLLSAYVFSDWLLGLIKTPQSRWLLWFLPLGIFVSGINQSFQAWCIRRKAFKKTASSQITRAGSVNTLQIITGIFRTGGSGLIASSVAANGFASLNLARQVFCTDKVLLKSCLTWKRIGRLVVEYRDFPVYSATQNMMNALSQGLPVLLLSHFYGIVVAGAYAFGVRILQVPMNLVLTALRQVLFQKASEAHNHGESLMPLYIKITAGLFMIAFFPTLILFIWAPQIFSWVFGSEWFTAGVFSRWLVLWIMIGFCNLPSVLFARILRQQKKLFLFELVTLVSRFLVLIVGGFLLTAENVIVLFSIIGCMLNLILIIWIGRFLSRTYA